MMSQIVIGVVKGGVVIPNAPLPEGASVEIHVSDSAAIMTPELRAELDAWQLAGANALELVERLAEQGKIDETR
jgi:hypothetical protein